jgi:hypothetical protein
LAAVQRPIRELAHVDPATGLHARGSPGYPPLPRCVAEALWSDPTHSDADAHKVGAKRKGYSRSRLNRARAHAQVRTRKNEARVFTSCVTLLFLDVLHRACTGLPAAAA